MKNFPLVVLLLIFSINLSMAQSFVDLKSKWYVDDCCVDFSSGELLCWTSEFQFTDTIIFDGITYHVMETNNPAAAGASTFYREENGKVYLKLKPNEEEFLIYDYSLLIGEKVSIGTSGFDYNLEVIGIDSITLNSGEKRKRLELAVVDDPLLTTHWVEGLGSRFGTMDTRYTFILDCWLELNCYFYENEVEYSLKDCMLSTDTKETKKEEPSIVLFPNPVQAVLNIANLEVQAVKELTILNANGVQHGIGEIERPQVILGNLPSGLYFLQIDFKDGKKVIKRFVKN